MKPYAELTESGRGRRLRRLALAALEQYDLPVERVRLIENGFNGIFRLDTRDGQKYVLRVTLPEGGHNRAHVMAEMDWLAALSRDTALSLPRPYPARSGALVVEARAEGVPEPRLCAVFGWVPGTDLADHLSPANVAKLGELSARLHLHALKYQPAVAEALIFFDRVFPFPEPVILFEPRFRYLFPPERYALFQRTAEQADAAIQRLLAGGEPMRVLHGDLHQWNVRLWRGVLSPIDFEDLMWGWPVQDIATTLYYFQMEDNYPELRAAFQQGYARVAPWPEQSPGEIEAFIGARALGMVNFVLQFSQAPQIDPVAFVERTVLRLQRL